MTQSFSSNAAWPAGFSAGLHAALCRRVPPEVPVDALAPLTQDLLDALEKGELTVPLTPQRRGLAVDSGWLEGGGSPLLIQGEGIGWRRWLEAMESVVEILLDRCG